MNALDAMKCVSARFDSHDLDDTRFLIDYLQLRAPAEVFDIIQAYYPKQLIPAKTQFLVEELLHGKTDTGATAAVCDV